MQSRIQNGKISVEVNSLGAELWGLKSLPDGVEHLWQGDPAHWARRAPVLFPIVGRLAGDRYRWSGREYNMGQHGFARDREFQLSRSSPDSLEYELLADELSRACYPFDFALHLGYKLSGRGLEITYEVANRGHGPMPFSIGAHPGFACPLLPGESFADYFLEFETPESARRHMLKDGLFAPETESLFESQKTLAISHRLFEKGALVFKNLNSRRVSLLGPKGRGVVIDFAGWPYLGIWTKVGAPFLCIEPWQGLADGEGFRGELDQKEGIVVLGSGESFERKMSISLSGAE